MQLSPIEQNQAIGTVPGTVLIPSMHITVANRTDTAPTVPISQLAYLRTHVSSKNAKHCSNTFRDCDAEEINVHLSQQVGSLLESLQLVRQ